MKKILLSTVALAGFTAGAMAADLPARRVAPIAPAFAAVPVFSWTGFYVGVNAGYGFSDRNSRDVTTVSPFTFGARPTFGGGTIQNSNNNGNDGFVGGGQIGYNYQLGQIVVGIEADIQYVDFSRNRDNTFLVTGNFPAGFQPVSDVTNLDYFGTVRGRIGYTGMFDRAMIYATGGFAYGGGDRNNNNSGFSNFDNNDSRDRTGYTIGGGVEYAFTNNITGKIEGLYVNLENNRRNGNNLRTIGFADNQPVVANVNGNRSQDTDFAVVRAGLNFKFNSF